MSYTAIDCQGFGGGMTLGVVQAGFELVGKREMTGGFGVPNCEANRALLGDNWQTQVSEPEAWQRVDADLVFGNPPCSGFSGASSSAFRGINSTINSCMWAFSDFVAACQPRVAIMESVRNAYTMGRSLMQDLRANAETKSGLNYGLYHVYQNAKDLGGASNRRRYFMVLSQLPFGVGYPRLEKIATLGAVIGDLDGLGLTWTAQPYRRPATWWSSQVRNPAGSVDGHVMQYGHETSSIAGRGLQMVRAFDWPPGAHLREAIEAYERLTGKPCPQEWLPVGKLGWPAMTLNRWHADQPARVIDGASMQRVIHPWQPRLVTHREAARVMGFPDDWVLASLRTVNGTPSTHGKGVTVQCGRWIATWARRALDGSPGELTGEPIGDREWFIDQPKADRLTPARQARELVDA